VAQRVAPQSRIADFTQPVALMLPGVVHHIPGTGQARSIVRRLVAALAPGSLLTINHSTSAVHGAAMEEAVAYWNRAGTPSMTLRTPQQIAAFFDGLDLLAPGVVSCSRWRVACQNPACGLTCCSTVGARGHAPLLPVHGPAVRLAGATDAK